MLLKPAWDAVHLFKNFVICIGVYKIAFPACLCYQRVLSSIQGYECL